MVSLCGMSALTHTPAVAKTKGQGWQASKAPRYGKFEGGVLRRRGYGGILMATEVPAGRGRTVEQLFVPP